MIQQKEVVTQVVGSYIKHVMPQLLAGVQILQNRENNRELKHEKVILWENFSPLTQKLTQVPALVTDINLRVIL